MAGPVRADGGRATAMVPRPRQHHGPGGTQRERENEHDAHRPAECGRRREFAGTAAALYEDTQ
jgi:hypothetical protein